MRCCIGLFSVRGKEFNLYVRSFLRKDRNDRGCGRLCKKV